MNVQKFDVVVLIEAELDNVGVKSLSDRLCANGFEDATISYKSGMFLVECARYGEPAELAEYVVECLTNSGVEDCLLDLDEVDLDAYSIN